MKRNVIEYDESKNSDEKETYYSRKDGDKR